MLNINKIRPNKIIYVIAYVFELMFYATKGHFIIIRTGLFGLRGKTIIYAAHMIGSLIVMLLWSNKFKHLIKISVAAMLFGFIPAIFVNEGYLKLIFGIIGMSGLGGAVTACRCGYAFATNNVEKLSGATLMIILVAFIHRLSWLGIENVFTLYVLPIGLLIALSICLLLFKEEDLEVNEEVTFEDKKGIYCAFAYFVAYFALDGFIWELAKIAPEARVPYTFIGMIMAGVIFFVMIAVLKVNVWHIWNIGSVFMIIGALLALLKPYFNLTNIQNLFNGLSIIGWPFAIYIMGCAQKRFVSYDLLKKCTIVFVIVSPLTTLLDDIVSDIFSDYVPLVSFIYIFAVIILLLLFSPQSYKYLFSALWLEELNSEDMNLIKEKVDQFDKHNLSNRQKEIATLLLTGQTRRQIAAELHLSESTVKTHTSELYRRLNINSRVELFAIFGVNKK